MEIPTEGSLCWDFFCNRGECVKTKIFGKLNSKWFKSYEEGVSKLAMVVFI